jgi:hypothetical protein
LAEKEVDAIATHFGAGITEEISMKLNLIFIVMDFLTLLAYPFIFVYEKIRWFLKLKPSPALADQTR